MGGAVLVALLLAAAVGAAWRVGGRPRLGFPLVVLYAALAYGVLLALMDAAAPFTAGGDDRAYFSASQVRLQGAGWFDFSQFRFFAQGGYPLMLAWVYQAAGASTFVYKAVNLFFFLLLVVIWYRIGSEMGGRRAAWGFALAVLLGTPLWLYWMFILKDMSIVLLHSLFLLGAVRLALGRAGMRTWVPVVASTVLLIPFRIYLVLLHGAVTIVTVVVAGRRSPWRKAAMLVGAGAMLGGLVYVGSNPDALRSLGVRGDDHALDYETVRDVSQRMGGSKYSGVRGAAVFPLVFVLGETSGLRVGGSGGAEVTAMTSRPDVVAGGLGALPWIFFGTPLFAYALGHIAGRPLRRRRSRDAGPLPPFQPVPVPRLRAPAGAWGWMPDHEGAAGVALHPVRVAAAPAPAPPAAAAEGMSRGWMPLLLYLVLYAVMAWVVEDTTRWRMPAFPVMAALAAQGWIWLGPRRRTLVVGGWATTLALLFTLYYGVLK